ncbi:MAG: F0F1 ATP synthase subunit B [Pseudomonadota bacterium]
MLIGRRLNWRTVRFAASSSFPALLLLTSGAFAAEAAEAGHGAWWEDTALWVSIGFIFVMGMFAYLGVHKTVASSLDARAQRIADELDNARRIREEAQEVLAQYQRRQREAEDEAQAIIAQAKKDAQRMAEETRETINDQIARRAAAAEAKIARAEAQALAEVRGQTADLAIETARSIIKSRVDQGAQSALIEKSIDDLRGKLN